MKKSITILEDDRDIREICAFVLAEEGYSVVEFENIASFELAHTNPSLFLLDVRLPDGSGLELCQRLKNDPKYIHTPIIIMSAHLQKARMEKQCLADGFLEKPFDIAFLLNQVATLVGREERHD